MEVGCGGGILTEPLARLGAQMTAIDLSAQSVAVAESRLDLSVNQSIKGNVYYLLSSVEEVAKTDTTKHFDAVVMSEVIEHNDDQQGLIQVCQVFYRTNSRRNFV